MPKYFCKGFAYEFSQRICFYICFRIYFFWDLKTEKSLLLHIVTNGPWHSPRWPLNTIFHMHPPPPPFQTTMLTHSGFLKNPSSRTLKLNGHLIFYLVRLILPVVSLFFGSSGWFYVRIFANLGASYKIALCVPPHPLQTTLLTHFGVLKNSSNRTLKLNGPLIIRSLGQNLDF